MKSDDLSDIRRRRFLQRVVGGAAGTAAVAAGWGDRRAARAAGAGSRSKILNYNQNMEYRRLGKTDLMVSAVSLGGHSRSGDRERREVISRAIDLGINYIDACTSGEVCRDARALAGRRDRMYLALSDCGREVRNEEYRTSRKLLEVLDALLARSGQEYTDLWRITCFEPGGRHTFNTACEIVEALEKARKQGKARFIGFSSHDRRWIRFMIEYFPQIEVVCFPFITMTKAAPRDSLFEALKRRDVGAFGIKPFAAASLFKGERLEDDRRARLALRYILYSNTVIPIPGVNSVREVDNAARAVVERRKLDLEDRAHLLRAGRDMLAMLPPNYQWLRDWEYV